MKELLHRTRDIEVGVDPKDAAQAAGLRYVSDHHPGLRRKKAGRGFTYLQPEGIPLGDRHVFGRIKSLAIPPAWTDVWICSSAEGHIQATGRDARKQYRYHPRFRELRESTKYGHLLTFAEWLPAIRAKVREHMALRGLPREKVLATVVHFLETTLIRVGNDYARANKSCGLTTLKNRHVEVNGSDVRFRFTGKGSKQWSVRIRDRRIANIIRACQELPGQELLQYIDEEGRLQNVTSGDVNDYLREITGADITAKDFRTWAGTAMTATALGELASFASAAEAKRNVRAAIGRVAARLGNTVAICRKCYVHPNVLAAHLERGLGLQIESGRREEGAGLEPEEAAVVALLRARLKAAAEGEAARPRAGRSAPAANGHARA